MSLALDNRTIILVYVIVTFSVGLLFYTQNAFKTKEGIVWNLANFTNVIGNVLWLFQGTLPDYVSVFGANIIIMLSICLASYSILVFAGRTPLARIYWIIYSGSVTLLAYSTFFWDSARYRIFIMCIVYIVVYTYALAGITKAYLTNKSRTLIDIVIFLSVLILANSYRLFSAINAKEYQNIMQSGLPLGIALIIGIVCIVGFNLCLYLLLNSKYQKELLTKNQQLEEALLQVNLAASTDLLTGLYNRRYMDEKFTEALQKANKFGKMFSIVLCDIDNFKQINDEFGHDYGDRALQLVSELLKDSCRAQDIIARWGGEEFLLLLPQTDLFEATKLAQRLLTSVLEKEFAVDKLPILRMTMTFGVATYTQGTKVNDVIKAADNALLLGKKNGKNRVESITID